MKSKSKANMLSSNVPATAKIGIWAFESDPGEEPRMYGDKTMLELLCADDSFTPEQLYHAWYDHIDDEAYGLVTDYLNSMIEGKNSEVQYSWHRPDGSVRLIKCNGARNNEYTKGIRLEGIHRDVTDVKYMNRGEEGLKRQQEISARLFALCDELECLYDVDMGTGEYEQNIEGRTFYEQVNARLGKHENFFDSVARDVSVIAHPDDRKTLEEVCSREFIRKILSEHPYYDHYYRLVLNNVPAWFKMRIVYKDKTKRNVIIGVFKADKEVAAIEAEKIAMEAEQATRDVKKAMDGFTQKYATVYRVRLDDGSFSTLKGAKDAKLKKCRVSEDFRECVAVYAENWVYAPDRELFKKELDFANIAKRIKKDSNYSVEYRALENDVPMWHEVTVFTLGNKEVLLGFKEKDSDILIAHIRDLIQDHYEAIYVANLNEKMIRAIKGVSAFVPTGKTYPYTETMEKFASCFTGEDKVYFEKMAKVGEVRRLLKTDGRCEYIYPSPYTEGAWMKMELYVLTWDENEEAETMAALLIQADTQQTEKVQLDRKIAEQNKQLAEQREQLEQTISLARYFINTFVSAYYLNLKDSTYIVLQRTEQLEKDYPSNITFQESIDAYLEKDVHPDDRDFIRPYFDMSTIGERVAKEGTLSAVFRDISGGVEKYYRFLAIPGADKDHVGFGFTDITDNINTKNELISVNRSLKLMVNATRQLYPLIMELNLTKNEYSMVEYDNFTTRQAKDCGTVDELIRVGASTIPDEDMRKQFYDLFNLESVLNAYSKGERMLSLKHTQVGDDGVVHWIHTTTVMSEIDGDIQAITFARPIDEEVAKEEENKKKLEEAAKKAEAANNAKTSFLFNMSHDIRTPMNAIIGYTAMAKKHSSEEKVTEYLEKIEISGNQLLTLVNQVLEMSRIESGKIVLEEQPADIVEKAYAVKTLTDTDVANKDQKYEVVIKDVTHKNVLCDVSRMNQVIINIVSNAVKYTPEGGSITYTVEELPSHKKGYGLYRFTVADTGIGMSEEFVGHIFDEFSRENTSTVSHIQGTGLGMSIVKRLVDLMKGTVTVQSKKGVGTTVAVTVYLKIDPENRAEETQQDISAETVSLNGKHILLVEDNEMNREIATEILEESGIIVTAVEDGTDAVEKMKAAKKGDFDLILMDIQMPVMNGYDATKAIRQLTNGVQDIPIVAMTANAFEEDRRNAFAAGMNEHLAKPIDINKLKLTIAKFV